MRDRVCPSQGLRMNGPVAADYMLTSYPTLA
jgi:hypothetical protein